MKRRVFLKGGLGDILVAIYNHDIMGIIESLAPGEEIQIFVASPCRSVVELFERHPKRKQLEIVNYGYVEPWKNEFFDPYGGVLPQISGTGFQRRLVRYTSPEDIKFLSTLPKKYIAFSLSASHDNRNIPVQIATEAAKICTEFGYGVLLLGRNYEPWHKWGETVWKGTRSEPVVSLPGVVSGIDVLTLPGALEGVYRSSAVLCSASSFQLAAWLYRKRSYVVTPYQFKPAIDMISEWVLGDLRYNNGHATVCFTEEWSADRFRTFLGSL